MVTCEFSRSLDVQHYLTPVPIAFGDGTIVLPCCTHHRFISMDRPSRNESESRGNVIDVELKFFLLIGRIEGSGDRSLPRYRKKGDDEFIGIWQSYGYSGSRGNAETCDLSLERRNVRVELLVRDGKDLGFSRHNDSGRLFGTWERRECREQGCH